MPDGIEAGKAASEKLSALFKRRAKGETLGTSEPQAWVTDDGRYAVRWFPDRPAVIVRVPSSTK
jgi:hypothetical protein